MQELCDENKREKKEREKYTSLTHNQNDNFM